MREGHFPPPTPTGQTFEADATIVFPKNNLFSGGEKTVFMPWIDIAGEEVATLVSDLNKGIFNKDNLGQMATFGSELFSKVLKASGLILIIPTSQISVGGQRLEDVNKGTDPNIVLSEDADVNLSRIVERIGDWKKDNGMPLKSLNVVMTKIDRALNILMAQGMDLRTKDGIDKFMSVHFPETYSILHFFGMQNVQFTPSWVEQAYNEAGVPMVWMPENRPVIKVDYSTRTPIYNIGGYLQLIDWIRSNFAS